MTALPTRIIDAHQHRWRLSAPHTSWPPAELAEIHRDFDADAFADARGGIDVDGVILVQAQPDEAETHWLLDLGADDPQVLGVVGWTDLAAPDAPERIAALAGRAGLVGLRPLLQSIEDTDWLMSPAVAPALEAIRAHGLRFDALVQPRHLPMLARFMREWPDIPVVVDHGAKPYAARGELDPWRVEIAALADMGAYTKLSGLRTEQAPGQPPEALRPYVGHLIASFGERLMWGSDWPVVRLAGDDWRAWLEQAAMLTGGADPDRLFAGSAAEFYGVG